MRRISYLNKNDAKVKYIYDFLNDKHSSFLGIKGVSKEGKKEALQQALSKCDESAGDAFSIEEIGYSEEEHAWSFININTGQLKIIRHLYSWDDIIVDSNSKLICFDKDPSYSSSEVSSSGCK